MFGLGFGAALKGFASVKTGRLGDGVGLDARTGPNEKGLGQWRVVQTLYARRTPKCLESLELEVARLLAITPKARVPANARFERRR